MQFFFADLPLAYGLGNIMDRGERNYLGPDEEYLNIINLWAVITEVEPMINHVLLVSDRSVAQVLLASKKKKTICSYIHEHGVLLSTIFSGNVIDHPSSLSMMISTCHTTVFSFSGTDRSILSARMAVVFVVIGVACLTGPQFAARLVSKIVSRIRERCYVPCPTCRNSAINGVGDAAAVVACGASLVSVVGDGDRWWRWWY